MILEEDSLLPYNYDITTQILSVTWPDLSNTPLPEIENSLQKLIRNIKNFDIRRMVVDLRCGFNVTDEAAYRKAVEVYHQNLAETHLEKLARIIPEKPEWEYYLKQVSMEMVNKYSLPFEIQFFTTKHEAIAWLLEP